MASSLQSLFSLPAFQDRYLMSFVAHPSTCTSSSPATCFECQMSKIADGLLSGRYSVPHVPESSDALAGSDVAGTSEEDNKPRVHFQEGVRPAMFKSLVGKDHPEFSTMRQQDAGEFLAHLLEYIRRASKQLGADEPTGIFGYAVEERLECTECHGVRYRSQKDEMLSLQVPVKERQTMDVESVPGEASASNEVKTTYEQDKERKVEYEPVELTSCLEDYTHPIEIEYNCPACEKKVKAVKYGALFPTEYAGKRLTCTSLWAGRRGSRPSRTCCWSTPLASRSTTGSRAKSTCRWSSPPRTST